MRKPRRDEILKTAVAGLLLGATTACVTERTGTMVTAAMSADADADALRMTHMSEQGCAGKCAGRCAGRCAGSAPEAPEDGAGPDR